MPASPHPDDAPRDDWARGRGGVPRPGGPRADAPWPDDRAQSDSWRAEPRRSDQPYAGGPYPDQPYAGGPYPDQPYGDEPYEGHADEADAEPTDPRPEPPVRRLLSLATAALAALLTAGMVFGALTTHTSYAIVIFGVQVLFVLAWTVASRPPAPLVVGVVGGVAAAAADIAAVWTDEASLAPLAYVTAGAFLAGVVGQLVRPAGRVRVTESLGSSLVVTVGVVALATLVVLTRHPAGTQALVACLLAAGLAVTVARLVDIVFAAPRLAPQVPRGGLGVVLGAMVGTAAAATAGGLLQGVTPQRTAVAGLVTAIVAVVVDLSVGYAEAGRRLDGDAPTLWIARHMQGPLGAFALSAPAAYAASALLVVHAF